MINSMLIVFLISSPIILALLIRYAFLQRKKRKLELEKSKLEEVLSEQKR